MSVHRVRQRVLRHDEGLLQGLGGIQTLKDVSKLHVTRGSAQRPVLLSS